MGSTQSGKTYFVQQISKLNRIVYEGQKSILIFLVLQLMARVAKRRVKKKSLGGRNLFERDVRELSEDLCEINPRYNNTVILDHLMAEARDSPAVCRLFTQGRHPNANVILLQQNMVKGNIIRISAKMPSTLLSFELQAILNK